MRKILGALAILLCLAATAAHAQLPLTLPPGTVVGRTIGAGPGDPEAIPLATIEAQVLALPNAVANSALAQMPANSIKCNNTASTANAADCTAQQTLNILNQSLLFIAATGVPFGTANTDTVLTIPAPPAGFTRYSARNVFITGATASLNPATVAVFTGAGGTGLALVASGTAVTVTSSADSTTNNMQVLSAANVNTMSNLYSALTLGRVYFRVQTPSTLAATAGINLQIEWLP